MVIVIVFVISASPRNFGFWDVQMCLCLLSQVCEQSCQTEMSESGTSN